jgi:hypothetical protein
MDCIEFLQYFMNISYVDVEDEKYVIDIPVAANDVVEEKCIIENCVLEVL